MNEDSKINSLWNKAKMGRQLMMDGKYIGIVEDKRVKYGGRGIQLTVRYNNVLQFVTVSVYNAYRLEII